MAKSLRSTLRSYVMMGVVICFVAAMVLFLIWIEAPSRGARSSTHLIPPHLALMGLKYVGAVWMILIGLAYLLRQKTDTITADTLVRDIIENEAKTARMQDEAVKNAGPSVSLIPVLPNHGAEQVGWFGGAPRLPRATAWPEIEGTPLCFVAQIDLSKLPKNIWSGVGPRTGSIAVFVHPEMAAVKVLHVEGEVLRRDGVSPAETRWFRNSFGETPKTGAYFPQWPVAIEEHVGALPAPSGYPSGKAPGFPNPFEHERLRLSNPAYHPFDAESLAYLLRYADEGLTRRIASISAFLTEKKLKDDTRAALVDLEQKVLRSRATFEEIKTELLPCLQTFNLNSVSARMPDFDQLDVGNIRYLKNDADGYAVIEVQDAKLTDPFEENDLRFSYLYLHRLKKAAMTAYLDDPASLSPEARDRFEQMWSFDALHERGGMSHPPKGFIYTPYGPSSPNEILLELPTSDLLGWIWGDMYSIVLAIPREDLAKGDFGSVIADITN
ncbi:DUF1963 domain-containing protein [Pseudosulfitobacter sp. SM2401]|uniref:DUF1963 domain-containing protein n=1 Tax=Pseudosulfitobacter sp. SM2401 TaxID=3350098 RepID=UPI0036F30A9B